MTTKFLENYRCPDLANINVGNVLFIIKNGMCVEEYLQKLPLNPIFRVTVIGLSRRLCRTFNMHRNNVRVIFLDWCEELINNSVRVIERFTKIPIRYNEQFISIRVTNLQKALQLLNTKI